MNKISEVIDNAIKKKYFKNLKDDALKLIGNSCVYDVKREVCKKDNKEKDSAVKRKGRKKDNKEKASDDSENNNSNNDNNNNNDNDNNNNNNNNSNDCHNIFPNLFFPQNKLQVEI